MPRKVIKCDTTGCHRRIKIDGFQQDQIRNQETEAGAKAGLLCPQCVKVALDSPDEYDFNMSVGEIMAEAMVDTPRWRIVFSPKNQR